MSAGFSLEPLAGWQPPPGWHTITTIDAHTGGEPLRIVVAGFPELPGDSILARRRLMKEQYDHLRRAIMWEPRGHREMYGCILTPPVTPGADFGVIFMHNEGFSTMCGHGVIAAATIAVDTAFVPQTEPQTVVRMDTPAGLVTARVRTANGRAVSVAFENVPSFVFALDQPLEVPGLGRISYDIAFGGAFYAYVNAALVGLHCLPEENPALVEKGMAIKRAVMASRSIVHPLEPDLGFLYGTIFVAPADTPGVQSRNVCIFADGEVDRSPTGTGVSGRMALHYARNEVKIGQPLVIESIVGSRFTGRVLREARVGPYAAVVPEVEGSACITGQHRFHLDPDDPFKSGFII
jgi:trans-L-3-hydroxyproline dehydratase